MRRLVFGGLFAALACLALFAGAPPPTIDGSSGIMVLAPEPAGLEPLAVAAVALEVMQQRTEPMVEPPPQAALASADRSSSDEGLFPAGVIVEPADRHLC